MPRSVWRGAISFGLVNIPISLYPATEPKDVRFHLFDREGRRVRYRRVVGTDPVVRASMFEEHGDELPEPREEPPEPTSRSAATAPFDTEVAYVDLMRGYEIHPDTFVLLEAQDIERARPQRSHTIDLEHFVRLEDIDPVYFEKTYYVLPRHGSEKPYLLLLRTLEGVGRVGIGRFVLRTKPHLVALRSMGGVLGLETLFFGDEVRDARPLVHDLEGVKITTKEVEVAAQLVEMLAIDWDPSEYADEYREGLLRIIAERTPEQIEREAEAAVGVGTRIEELMDALLRSVEDAKAAQATKKRRRKSG